MLRLGYNQTSLAAKSGVSVATIRKLEKGADQGYAKATIYRLAAILHWDASEFARRAAGLDADHDLELADVGQSASTGLAAMQGNIGRLSEEDRQIVESLIAQLLDRSK